MIITRTVGNICEQLEFEHPMDCVVYLVATGQAEPHILLMLDRFFSGAFDDD